MDALITEAPRRSACIIFGLPVEPSEDKTNCDLRSLHDFQSNTLSEIDSTNFLRSWNAVSSYIEVACDHAAAARTEEPRPLTVVVLIAGSRWEILSPML